MAYGPQFDRVNVAGNYFAGRDQATQEQQVKKANALADRRIQMEDRRMQQEDAAISAEQKKQLATTMLQAAQYGIQSSNPKAFIEQNYPQIAQLAGDKWAALDDEGVRSQLRDAQGIFGPMAGVGPAAERGAGAMYKYTNDKGEAVYGDASDVRGRPVYDAPSERAPPAGYRIAAGGRLEPIPGGPADPNTPNTRDDTRIFAKADKLRDEFNNASKDFIAVGDSYNTVRAAAQDPSAAGDLSMIFAYMKMLDPNSVVREQEFANAQNAAGIPDRVRNSWNKALAGERLNPSQRADFIAQAEKVYKIRKTRNDGVVKRYSEIAKRNKVNPDDVVGDLGVYEETAAPSQGAAQQKQPQSQGGQPVQVRSAQEAAALPSGTVFITPDGRRKVRP